MILAFCRNVWGGFFGVFGDRLGMALALLAKEDRRPVILTIEVLP